MVRKQRTGRGGILNYHKTFYFLETNVWAELLVRCMSKNVFETVSHLTTLLKIVVFCWLGFPGNSDGKEFFQERRRPRFDPWVGKIPWRREWQPTPVFLPGEFHGERSLAGCSSDATEQLTLLAWKIPWTEEPGGLQSMGSQSWTRLSYTSTHFAGYHCSFWRW